MRAPETIAGRYRVERPIGQGGMGTVWLCSDEVLGREVAVKQVGLMPGESAPDLARALREARSSAALNHPHVVSIFDAVEDDDDRLWLVMEHVPGTTLAELIRAEGRLEPRRVAAIGAQVAGGLAAAHARGTVHRDVKPGNVLVDGGSAKISDFGIARTEGDAQLTRSGLLIGTPLFFSPELARGDDPSPSDDVWALGASLYAAVEGRLPIEDRGNPIATLAAIASGTPPRPEHAGPLTPVLARMLDPDPTARCSMAEAVEALGRLAAEGPTQTLETPMPVVPVAVPVDPHPTTAEPEPALFPPPTATPAPVPAVDRGADRRRSPWLLVAALVLLLLAAGGLGVALLTGDGGRDAPSADPAPSTTERTDASSSAPSPSGETSSSPTPTSQAPDPAATTPAIETDGPEALVTDYYALLPDDTETAWGYLGGEARSDAGGYGGFSGFWDTIESVSVSGTSLEGDVVTVDLLYDGSESETRRLRVEESGQGWVIADDLGPV